MAWTGYTGGAKEDNRTSALGNTKKVTAADMNAISEALTDHEDRIETLEEIVDVTTGITAYAGGGQANATQLSYEWNEISVVATTNDSVKLPNAIVGKSCVADNSGAETCNVFPKTGESIVGLSANAAVKVYSESYLKFICKTAGTWQIIG